VPVIAIRVDNYPDYTIFGFMLLSMTGYGKAECELSKMVYSIEIKSLNSKQLDISVKLPVLLRDRELEIRNHLGQELLRGKIDFGIYQDVKPGEGIHAVNKEVAREYIRQLSELASEAGMESSDSFLQVAMRLPDAIRSEQVEIGEEEWDALRENIIKALGDLQEFRQQEGLALEKDIRKRIGSILEKLSGIAPFEKVRIENIRSRIRTSMDELGQDQTADPGRFEQEMIFYLEKYDITEEQVRLKNHCEYFLESMESDQAMGKKLGFISQEMGREINTLGSKAYDAGIQRLVVEMKDELEKIKEQLLNVL
jgi:uncharacterized protein (TIGR00255 family)